MRPRTFPTPRARRWMPAALLLALALPAAARAQGVSVALTPASQSVPLGADVYLDITVTQAGSSFNGFDAAVTFDPAALTFVPTSPTSQQQGCLMTGACSIACGNTFHRFDAAGDSVTVTDILLCDQTALTGPGQVYRLHFQAGNTPQVTYVRFRHVHFYNAGFFVNPVTSADATIGVGVTLDVGGPPPGAGLRLRAEPNPARGAVALSVAADAPGIQDLAVYDVTGRMVRRLASGWYDRGTRQVRWDGRDAWGARVPAGVYLVTLRAGSRSARARVALIE